jgi:glutathione S-transferase
MLTLYHAPQSRSSRILWLLEELDAEYDIKTVSIRRRDPAAEGPVAPMIGARDPQNVHPHGKVPALVHDGVTIFESAAVVLYLTDAFPRNRIGPAVGDPLRGPYLSWLAYYTGVMEPAFTAAMLGLRGTDSTIAWAPVDDVLAYVEAALAKGPYILGETFSGADVLVGSVFILFMGSPLLPRTDLRVAYVERLTARPAYRRAQAEDGAAAN